MRIPALALAISVSLHGVATAGVLDPIGGYLTAGASQSEGNSLVVKALSGSVGVRFGDYFGLEAEGGFGFNRDTVIYSLRCPQIELCDFVPITGSEREKSHGFGYVVGYIPLWPQTEIFGKIGYGAAQYSSFSEDSVNLGGGAQFFFYGKNGIRLDYTRRLLAGPTALGDRLFGSGQNVFSAAFVRRF